MANRIVRSSGRAARPWRQGRRLRCLVLRRRGAWRQKKVEAQEDVYVCGVFRSLSEEQEGLGCPGEIEACPSQRYAFARVAGVVGLVERWLLDPFCAEVVG